MQRRSMTSYALVRGDSCSPSTPISDSALLSTSRRKGADRSARGASRRRWCCSRQLRVTRTGPLRTSRCTPSRPRWRDSRAVPEEGFWVGAAAERALSLSLSLSLGLEGRGASPATACPGCCGSSGSGPSRSSHHAWHCRARARRASKGPPRDCSAHGSTGTAWPASWPRGKSCRACQHRSL